MAEAQKQQDFQDLPHILVVDDDDRIRSLVSRYLNEHGFLSFTAADAQAAKDILKVGVFDALVVDVSSIADYEAGHIPGARHVAIGQFDPESKELAKVRDRPVAVVCRNGQVSGQAAKRLRKAGFSRVYWLEGGARTWIDAHMPLVKGRATG